MKKLHFLKASVILAVFCLGCSFCYGQTPIKVGMQCGTENKQALKYFETGNFGLQTKRYEDAARLFYAAIKLDSTFCDAWDHLAICYNRIGRYEEAFNAGIYSLIIDSTNVSAWLNCADASFNQNDLDRTLQSYDNLQRIVPKSPEGYYGKSMVYYLLDQFNLAKHYMTITEQKYKDINKKIGQEVFLLKGFIEYKSGNEKEAQKLFKKVYSKYKNLPELNYYYGQCILINDNNIKKSNKYIDKAIKLGYVAEDERQFEDED